MKYAVNVDISKKSKDEFLRLCTKSAIRDKKKILEYMKSFEVYGYSTAYILDVVNQEETDLDEVAFTDGDYLWSSSWIYHFEKYNLKLNDDFISHVLSKMSE